MVSSKRVKIDRILSKDRGSPMSVKFCWAVVIVGEEKEMGIVGSQVGLALSAVESPFHGMGWFSGWCSSQAWQFTQRAPKSSYPTYRALLIVEHTSQDQIDGQSQT